MPLRGSQSPLCPTFGRLVLCLVALPGGVEYPPWESRYRLGFGAGALLRFGGLRGGFFSGSAASGGIFSDSAASGGIFSGSAASGGISSGSAASWGVFSSGLAAPGNLPWFGSFGGHILLLRFGALGRHLLRFGGLGGASSPIRHAQGGIFSGSAASEGIFFFFGLAASGVIFFSGLGLKFEEDMVFKCPLKIVLLTPKDFNILHITIAQ